MGPFSTTTTINRRGRGFFLDFGPDESTMTARGVQRSAVQRARIFEQAVRAPRKMSPHGLKGAEVEDSDNRGHGTATGQAAMLLTARTPDVSAVQDRLWRAYKRAATCKYENSDSDKCTRTEHSMRSNQSNLN